MFARNWGRHGNLNVHHLIYDRLGRERPSDLIVICRLCHRLIHDALDSLRLETGWDREETRRQTVDIFARRASRIRIVWSRAVASGDICPKPEEISGVDVNGEQASAQALRWIKAELGETE